MAASEITPEIVAIGEPMIEFNQTTANARDYLQGFGGDTSNFCVAVARHGGRPGYVTRLGDDAFGRGFLDLWRTEGVDTSGVVTDPQAHTAVYFVMHDERGHAFSYLRKGSAASRLSPENVPLDLVGRARYLHVSGITQAISQAPAMRCWPRSGTQREQAWW